MTHHLFIKEKCLGEKMHVWKLLSRDTGKNNPHYIGNLTEMLLKVLLFKLSKAWLDMLFLYNTAEQQH